MKKWIPRILLLVLVLLFLGVLTDALTGFTVIRHSDSVFGSIGALLILGVLYLFAEGLGERVADIDKTEQPLWRRVFNLCVLLLAMVVIGGVFYYVLNYIGT